MDKLRQLYQDFFGFEPKKIEPLALSGSNRKYFRIFSSDNSIDNMIGVVGTSVEENRSFINLAQAFRSCHLNVPIVYVHSEDEIRYIQQDLGNTSLYQLITHGRENGGLYNDFEINMIRKVIAELPKIQMELANDYVFSLCYPMKKMDYRSVMFDLNYFKYSFLKLTGTDFNENNLQDDFENFANRLISVREYGFQYRDFQARNIMIVNEKPYYIDFQGGRCGPVYYDLASFLWQASSNFSDDIRKDMIDVYLDSLSCYIDIDKHTFLANLKQFVLFRLLQVLGAYGFRGLWEKKQHFIDSIPSAISNLNNIIDSNACDEYPVLKETACKMIDTYCSRQKSRIPSKTQALIENDTSYYAKAVKPLVVRVNSFSYKKGIPIDDSGNGGGYVFDCRSTHNPGRYEQFKQLTGLDQPVITFLEEDGEILNFLDSIYKLADFHVQRFIDRGFTNLMFSFGCTGGQHRSVYSAQHLAEHINKKFGIEVHICHREQNIRRILPCR